jgi:caffeoyl-CoA O-methyltransferase
MELTPPAIDAYAKAHASGEDPLLAELTRETWASAQYPQMQTGHVEGSLLYLLARMINARRILEIGTYTGYSSLSLARALPESGVVITCDIDPVATDMARRYWARSPHGHKIVLRLAPALETIAAIEGSLDLVFIDADKENYGAYWDGVLPLVRPGGLIIADNVLWSGKVLDPKDPSDHAIVAFNEKVRADDRVESVLLTVRDGITLARKKDLPA